MNNFGRQQLVPGATPNNYNTGVGWAFLQVINESPYLLSLNFSGLGSMDFPAWHREDIAIGQGYTGSLYITPTQYSNQTGANPSTLVTVNGFAPGELAQPMSVALSRLTNIGNNLNVGTSVTQLINDGNAVQNLVEATPSGDPGSAVLLTTAGVLTLGNATHHGSISSDNGKFTTDGSGDVAAVNITASGTLGVTGVTTLANVTTGVITCGGGYNETGGDMNLNTHNLASVQNITMSGSIDGHLGNAHQFGTVTFDNGATMTGGDLALNTHNITSVGTINGSGDFTCTGVNFGTGTIHRVAKQTASLAIGHNSYTHNLGWQPDACFLIATVGGGGSDTVGWDTATTTTVNFTCGAALHHDILFLKY